MKSIGILFLLFPFTLLGQIQLERQSISPLGLNGGNNVQLSSTIGSVEYLASDGENYALHQGFEQGLTDPNTFTFTLETPICDDGSPFLLTVLTDSICPSGTASVLLDNLLEDDQIEIQDPGTYSAQVTCENGATYFEEITIEEVVLPGCNLFFYNVITPNSELDYWYIENIDGPGFTQNKVSIINRWGEVIWQAENYDNQEVRWSGTDQSGEILAQGTYYYLVEVGDSIFKGFIELIR